MTEDEQPSFSMTEFLLSVAGRNKRLPAYMKTPLGPSLRVILNKARRTFLFTTALTYGLLYLAQQGYSLVWVIASYALLCVLMSLHLFSHYLRFCGLVRRINAQLVRRTE